MTGAKISEFSANVGIFGERFKMCRTIHIEGDRKMLDDIIDATVSMPGRSGKNAGIKLLKKVRISILDPSNLSNEDLKRIKHVKYLLEKC